MYKYTATLYKCKLTMDTFISLLLNNMLPQFTTHLKLPHNTTLKAYDRSYACKYMHA